MENKALLPPYSLLLRASIFAILPLIAASLLAGKAWWAISLLAGWALGTAVGGLLHIVVGHAVNLLMASRSNAASPSADAASKVQFIAMVMAKFLIVVGLAWAIVSVHGINLLIMLAGFLVCHIATIVAANRFMKSRSSASY